MLKQQVNKLSKACCHLQKQEQCIYFFNKNSCSKTKKNNINFKINNIPKYFIHQRPQPKLNVFNRESVKKHKEYSFKVNQDGEFDYVKNIIADSIIDRLSYITKELPSICEIGCGKGYLLDRILNKTVYDYLEPFEKVKYGSEEQVKLPILNVQKIQNYVLCEQSKLLLDSIKIPTKEELKGNTIQTIEKVHFDEDGITLPFEDNTFDCVIHGFSLHWVNDLPKLLSEIERILKPDGVFIGAMLGGDTLAELRTAFVLSEQEREGGVSPHVSPLSNIENAGNALTRAGFNIPTIDSEVIRVFYPDAFTLMNHLQGMGENNSLLKRRAQISRETIVGAAAIYDLMFKEEERGVLSTFEVIYLIGWKKDVSQPK
ncbi:hypothetical protein ABK040_002959 [Willaertia magna]